MTDRLYVICEGQSENAFVKNLLTPYLGTKLEWKVKVLPYTLITSANLRKGIQNRGGLLSFRQLENDMKRCMAYGCPVTTMVDYYRLPDDFPGYEDLTKFNRDIDRVIHLERSMKGYFLSSLPDYPKDFFIPYIQVHEFEALFFSDLAKLKRYYLNEVDQNGIDSLIKDTNGLEPEDIDSGEDTAPAKRLEKNIAYHKGSSIVIPLGEIGIERMRERCSHFNDWVEQILNLWNK